MTNAKLNAENPVTIVASPKGPNNRIFSIVWVPWRRAFSIEENGKDGQLFSIAKHQ
jgi:hypothetical protein